MNKKIITYDIETILIDEQYYPFSVGIYDGFNFKYFYINNTNNIKHESSIIMESSYNYLLSLENINKKIIYVHNLSKFDSIFILKYSNFKNADHKIYFHNNNVYKIILYNKLIFHDSLKIISQSLSKACESYNIINKKQEIDYNMFIIPKIFDDNIKGLIVEYLKYDCISLYEIMIFFTDRINTEYGIKPNQYLTIATLSFKIWKKMNKDILLESNINDDKWKDTYIRSSYFGGRCEIYKPYVENIAYYYDVNSLYPFVMKNMDYPIGKGKYIVWNNTMNINDFYGFLRCEISFTDNYILPVLPYRNENNIVIYPIGYWTGIYFIEEIKLALKMGYIIKPIDGIMYNKLNIFNTFIESMYNKRLSSKTNGENSYYKLIMNSLSGKFAMKESEKNIEIVNNEDYYKIIKNDEIIIHEILEIHENLTLITYSNKKNKSYINSHVQISSAITSYARCYMYTFLNNKNIYYTDTDSIITKEPLNDNYISQKELGKFKLEHIINKGYFISLKCYYINTIENNKIIKFKSLKNIYINQISEDFFKSYMKPNIIKPSIEILEYFKIQKSWKKINIMYNKLNIKYTLPYNKRKKIYKWFTWVDTKPWYINRKK